MRARRLVGFGAITVIAYAGAALFLSPLLWMIITSLKDLGSVALFPPQLVPDPVVPQNYVDALTFMLTGGDDYALVATFSSQASLPEGWTAIGAVSDGAGILVDGKAYEGPAGHQHFR